LVDPGAILHRRGYAVQSLEKGTFLFDIRLSKYLLQ
jgi:hypothetical protein